VRRGAPYGVVFSGAPYQKPYVDGYTFQNYLILNNAVATRLSPSPASQGRRIQIINSLGG